MSGYARLGQIMTGYFMLVQLKSCYVSLGQFRWA